MCKTADLGLVLQRLRNDAKLSREQLAAKSGVHWKTIMKYEYGNVQSRKLETVEQILRGLGYSVEVVVKRGD